METVKVYSPVEDDKVRQNPNDSKIWSNPRYHIDELELAKDKHDILFEYTFKFDGLKLVQFTGIKKIKDARVKERSNERTPKKNKMRNM